MATAARRGKSRIRPPRKVDPSVTETWAALSRAVQEIHNNNASNLSFEENYRYAYTLVLHKQGDLLYNGVNALVAANVDRLADEIVKPAFPSGVGGDQTIESQECERLLKALRTVWDDHTGSMSKLRDVLKYVDRSYAPFANVPVIWDAGMQLFHDHMIKPPIKEHVIDAILNQIRIEREGYMINRSAVKSCVDVLLQLADNNDGVTVYKRDVEPAMLKESRAYYNEEGRKLIETCDTPEYLRRVEDRLNSEEYRAHHYLSSQTAAPLTRILEENLLTPHLQAILSKPNSGLDSIIDQGKIDDASRLYRLFNFVPPGLPSLKSALKASILQRGKAVNEIGAEAEQENEEPEPDTKPKGKGKARANVSDVASKWVQDVLALKDKFDNLWKEAFQSDREIETSLNSAFETVINANPRSPEFISLFLDENLRKGLKGKTDQEIDSILDKTIVAFRYITEKDVFERYYKNHLAKRLLFGRSLSDDAERSILAKLKVECGYQYTQKMEGMFNDIKVSADVMSAYRLHLSKVDPVEIETSVTVMTSTFWPMNHSASPCNLPPVLVNATKSFEKFYFSRHSGRRLTWQPGLGNVDVRVAFKDRTHDLNVATFALVVLLLFEETKEGEFLTYEEIKDATGIDEPELKRHLQSLACARFKILKKHPPSRDVNETDSFSFNHGFTASLQRIKIQTISSRVENPEERKATQDRVEEERRYQTEACIVRVMKDRKHMSHNDLINEVTRQLATRFQPNPLNIKKRIEGLIEREYLERCEDRKSYNYLA